VRLTAWLILSVLTIEPTLAHAAAGDLPDRKSPTAKQGTPTAYTVDFTWAQIQRLVPGTKIMVRKPGVTLLTHRFLSANEDTLKTLAVSDMAVQFAKQLHKAAATHPEYFLQPTPAGTRIVLDDHVSLKDAAVFVDGRRVADLQEFVVTISCREIENGSATVSMVPVANRLPLSVKVLIGAAIAIVAFGIIVRQLVPYT